MANIVLKTYPGDDKTQITATTYQMRNFYRQFSDGFFSVLDVMNYIQHQTVVRMAKADDRILDMCCGRGLLLPMLRYERKTIESYTGIDIAPTNAIFKTKRVNDGKSIEKGYYPFRVYFVEGNVAVMNEKLPNNYFTFIVYTSSIEHMQKADGLASLYAARKVAQKGARMFLSCPNTPEDQNGYDTQYAAHIYEWKRSEIIPALKDAGWKLVDQYGLLIAGDTLKTRLAAQPNLQAAFQRQAEFIPRDWLYPIWAPLFPDDAKEIAFIAEAV
jgi:ubiquinone/menaquinone biosynthesis C-methylase UbiE